jgi:hypothetical protein
MFTSMYRNIRRIAMTYNVNQMEQIFDLIFLTMIKHYSLIIETFQFYLTVQNILTAYTSKSIVYLHLLFCISTYQFIYLLCVSQEINKFYSFKVIKLNSNLYLSNLILLLLLLFLFFWNISYSSTAYCKSTNVTHT